MAARIAAGGIEHETSSFVLEATSLDDYNKRTVFPNDVAKLGNANTIVDGFVNGLNACGLEVAPLVWVKGTSGGPATRETYGIIKQRLMKSLEEALPVDGVLLSLHGSFAAEGIDDADADVLQSVRELVGPDCPIITVHDLHCNLSIEMATLANALIVERTYPHTDMAERGIEAARLMARICEQGVKPVVGFRSLPLLWAAPKMITSESPMLDAIQQLESLDQQPGVLSTSLGVGYQWIDSPVVGASTVVVTDGDAEAAQQHADELAHWVWDRREIWQRKSVSPTEGLEQGEAAGRYPIILADQADNTGGGAPGDSTEILRLFVERDLQDAAVLYVVDPQVAQIAKTAGVGATINVNVGGKSHPSVGLPVKMSAEVMSLSDGHFTYDGPMWKDVKGFMGDSVWLKQRGVLVVIISERHQPVDLAFCRSLGLDCAKMRYITVKSTGHFRSGFEPIAGSIHNVDAASLLTQDFSKLPFTRLGRKMYPLDADAVL